MGLNIREIIPRKQIEFADLRGKTVAVDAFNVIYQFLSSIRQYDGTPLKDKYGNVTSHLSGLFYRNINLLLEGIKLVYVFDGDPPAMKLGTKEKRDQNKDIAKERYNEAAKRKDFAAMRKYSQQMTKITDQIILESKALLEAMGVAIIQAPGEGEAQASFLAQHKDIYAVASQDYDCLLFNAPRLIQNLTLARKRKTISGYVEIKPELIELDKVLNQLQIGHEQLVSLGILVGTDYNIGGIKGIGQKKALQTVQRFKQPALIFQQFPNLDFEWQEIFEMFNKPKIDREIKIEFPPVNEEKIKEILMKHDFSEERIEKQIERLKEVKKRAAQKTLF